jgi:hypothetical protein
MRTRRIVALHSKSESQNRRHVIVVETVDKMVAGADGDGHHGERRILTSRRDEAGAVHDEKILYVVRLVEAV